MRTLDWIVWIVYTIVQKCIGLNEANLISEWKIYLSFNSVLHGLDVWGVLHVVLLVTSYKFWKGAKTCCVRYIFYISSTGDPPVSFVFGLQLKMTQ